MVDKNYDILDDGSKNQIKNIFFDEHGFSDNVEIRFPRGAGKLPVLLINKGDKICLERKDNENESNTTSSMRALNFKNSIPSNLKE